jgi:hypothetical protein
MRSKRWGRIPVTEGERTLRKVALRRLAEVEVALMCGLQLGPNPMMDRSQHRGAGAVNA